MQWSQYNIYSMKWTDPVPVYTGLILASCGLWCLCVWLFGWWSLLMIPAVSTFLVLKDKNFKK
jgi:hypothetical protein